MSVRKSCDCSSNSPVQEMEDKLIPKTRKINFIILSSKKCALGWKLPPLYSILTWKPDVENMPYGHGPTDSSLVRLHLSRADPWTVWQVKSLMLSSKGVSVFHSPKAQNLLPTHTDCLIVTNSFSSLYEILSWKSHYFLQDVSLAAENSNTRQRHYY